MQTVTGAGVTVDARRPQRDAEFVEYMQARQDWLLRTAYLLTGDRPTAEDLVQASLAKLYLAWDKVRDRDSVDAYVRRILVNENNSLWRRSWKKREYTVEALPDRVVADAYDEGQHGALWQIVQTLPKKARAVVVLRYYEELSETETAEVLGISRGTVKSQTSRALEVLRAHAPRDLNPCRTGEEADS